MMIHPDDENGDVLRRLEAKGDDLTRPRDIDFTVAFPVEGSAKQFAEHFRTLGHTVSDEFREVAVGFPWDVVVVKKWRLPTRRSESSKILSRTS